MRERVKSTAWPETAGRWPRRLWRRCARLWRNAAEPPAVDTRDSRGETLSASEPMNLPHPRVRTKLVLLSLLIFLVVSFASAVSVNTLARQWIEEDLEERAISFAREIAVTIRDRRDFENRRLLASQIRRISRIRPNVLQLDILVFDGEETRMAASSGSEARLPFTRADAGTIRRGRVISRLVEDGAGRYWEILAPITVEGVVEGAVAAKFSSQRVDQLTARLAVWGFAMTAVSVAVMGLLMSLAVRLVVDRPVSRFMSAIRRIRDGDAGVTVDLAGHDEFGALARHFNEMMAVVNRFSAELQVRVKQATAELDRRYDEVQHLNALLFEVQRKLTTAERLALSGRLMAEVAHEVGTPLHSVAGHLELLRRDLPPALKTDDLLRRLDVIEAQVARVIEIISRLLDVTRRPADDSRPVDVNALVREMAELVRPGLATADLSLAVTPAAVLPPVEGHPDQLQQVVLNLLTNAIDATPAGGHIEIATRALPDQGEVEVSVADTGVGIPAADRPHIFDPFFSTKPARRGTGLGLFITAQIVRDHKGRIEVDSAPGQGSTFRVLLPAGGSPR